MLHWGSVPVQLWRGPAVAPFPEWWPHGEGFVLGSVVPLAGATGAAS